MNVLILNPILFSGDGNKLPKVKSIKDTMIYNMALGFINAGHNVTLLAMEEYTPAEKEDYDFEILFFKNNALGVLPLTLPLSIKMHKYIKSNANRFDMILAKDAFGFHTLSAAITAPEKTVIWQELNLHQKKFHKIPSKIWHNIIVRCLYRNIVITIGTSEVAKQFISQYVKHVDTATVDHGINIDKFVIYPDKLNQFISIAQLIDRKRIDIIINKFAKFISDTKYSDYKLLIAGRGPLEDKLKALVKELRIENNVSFLGFLDHNTLNKYVSESKASLINSNREMNMVSIPETIVSGTPIITNMTPAQSAYINANHLGIANDDWDTSEMIEIIENNTFYKSNCIAQRKLLSSTNVADRIVSIFLKHSKKSL